MDIDNYISSYNKENFLESVNVKNSDGFKNENYLWESFTTWLENSDYTAEEYRIEDKAILKRFNNQLFNFVIQVVYLYRQISYYELDSSVGKTGVLIGQDRVLETLSSIKFSKDIIDDYVLRGKEPEAILFRKYCIKKFNETVDNIEVLLSIRLKKSPLKKDIKNVANLVKKSINLKELEYLREINKITVQQIQEPKIIDKKQSIKAPVLAFFCSLINEMGVVKKEEAESATNYCKRICAKYILPYTDRVRQNFYGNETKKIRREFLENVLPLLDDETKSKIQRYLDNKYPPIQNLYT